MGRGGSQRLVRQLDDRNPIRQAQRRLKTVGQPRGDVLADDDAVDHHVDIVLVLLVEFWRVRDLVKGAIDLDALKTLLLQLGQLLAELALAAAQHRRQQVGAGSLGQLQRAIHHLRDGLTLDRQAGGGRIGHADAGEQKPQVVVDLGDGADRGARVLRGRLLLDGNGRRQPVDVVDVGLLHHLQELARVGGQALHVAALALGVNGVEGEARLSRTRQPGEHHQRVARDFQVDVLQVVLARAADVDGAVVHGDGAGGGGLFRRFAHGAKG